MASQNKTIENDNSVDEFLSSLPEEQRQDSQQIIKIMSDIAGVQPKMWGSAIIGFGSVGYRYSSGREGTMPILGFSPRKGKMVVYLYGEMNKYNDLLDKLGPHQTGKVCLYIKKLSLIDDNILREAISRCYEYVLSRIIDGYILD